jgi:hypothetical protein
MAQVTPNTSPKPQAAKPKAKRTRVSRKPRLKLVDLHAPDIDPRGRVDVLVARGLKLVVAGTPNPLVQTLYSVAQPVIDAEIQRMLSGFNIGDLLKMRPGNPVMPGGGKAGKTK